MTISMEAEVENPQTNCLEQGVQDREFCRKRISEIDSLLKEAADGHLKYIGRKVQFVLVSSFMDYEVKTSVKHTEENGETSAKDTEENEETFRDEKKIFICDYLLLVVALRVSGGTSWLLRELKACLDQSENVTILLPDQTTYEDLIFLVHSFTEWTPSNPSLLERILTVGIGKDLGLDSLLDNNKNEEATINGPFGIVNEKKNEKLTNYDGSEDYLSKETLAGGSTIPYKPRGHKCSECGKSFAQRKLLNRHIRTIHAKHNPNTCQVRIGFPMLTFKNRLNLNKLH